MATISNLIVNMIARTANFVGGMNTAKRSMSDFQKSANDSMILVGRSMKVAFAARLLIGFVNGMTEATKATKEGENAIVAFGSKIPVVGGIVSSIKDFKDEVNDVKKNMEGTAMMTDLAAKKSQSLIDLKREFSILSVGEDDAKRLTALYKYQDTLEKIKSIEVSMQKAKSMNPDLVMPNFSSEKVLAMKIYTKELENINNALDAIRRNKALEEMNNIWDVRKGIMNQITDMENSMAGMSDDMVNMLSKMRDIGAPFEDIQDMIKDVRKLEETRSKYNEMFKDKKTPTKSAISDNEIMRQNFQEIRPNLINVAALYPTQNPVVSALGVTNNLLREIRDGELA